MDPIETLRTAASRVFPLRVTPFEAFLLADETASHPMVFFMQLDLEGDLDREMFDRALEWVSWRHPLLRAKLEKRGAYDGRWLLDADSAVTCSWQEDESPIHLADQPPFDLTRECGLRVWGQGTRERSSIVFQFHHACSDGIGALLFIGDLLAAYDYLSGESKQASELQPLDFNQLVHRRFVRSPSLRSAVANAGRSVGLWWNRYLWRQTAPLAASSQSHESRPFTLPGFIFHGFNTEETNRLREASRINGVTLNTLMLRDLMRCLHQWSRAQTSEPLKQLSILVPVDLRERIDAALPACNRLGYSFADWRLGNGEGEDQLLASLEKQAIRNPRRRQAMVHVQGLSVARRARTMSWLIKPQTCLATAVLSNIGDPTRRFTAKFRRQDGRVLAGKMMVERILGAPPLRPGTRVGMTVGIYSGRLGICFRTDPLLFDQSETRRMLDSYVQRLSQSADEVLRR